MKLCHHFLLTKKEKKKIESCAIRVLIKYPKNIYILMLINYFINSLLMNATMNFIMLLLQ